MLRKPKNQVFFSKHLVTLHVMRVHYLFRDIIINAMYKQLIKTISR